MLIKFIISGSLSYISRISILCLSILFFSSNCHSKSLEIHGSLNVHSSNKRQEVIAAYNFSFFSNAQSVSGEYCKVWYGKNSVSYEYADSVLSIADNAIKKYIEFGYTLPKGDFSLAENSGVTYETGGDNLIDIYLIDVSSRGYLGLTNSDEQLSYKNSSGIDASPSYVFIDDDYFIKNEVYDTLKITVAHELFHVIQSGYVMFNTGHEYTQLHSFMEMSAVLMEEMLYPQVNDYINTTSYYFQIDYFTPFPSDVNEITYRITYEMYGAALWIIYLTDIYGVDVITDVWEKVATGYGTLESFEKVLAEHGDTFSGFWKRFIGEMLLLPSPESAIRDSELLPHYYITDTVTKTLSAYSGYYSTYIFYGLSELYYYSHVIWELEKSSTHPNTYFVFYPYEDIDYDSVYVSHDDTSIKITTKEMVLFPNPVSSGNIKHLYIANNIFKQCMVKVYSVTGALVYQTNIIGSKVVLPDSIASGVYIMHVSGENDKNVYLRFVVYK